jgi:hypothetical protein
MSEHEERRSRDMDSALRRGVRGEPSGRPLQSETEVRDAAERHLREGNAHREEPSIWTRFTHSLGGKLHGAR